MNIYKNIKINKSFHSWDIADSSFWSILSMVECVSLLPFEILNEYDASVVDAQLYTSLPFKKIGLSRILPSNLALFSIRSNNNTLSASCTKWSNKLRQLVGNSRMLSVFEHFVWLALKWSNFLKTEKPYFWHFWNNFFPKAGFVSF